MQKKSLLASMTTPLDWADGVLDALVLEQVQEIRSWVRHSRARPKDRLRKRLAPAGYACLFRGAPGTGKKLAAALLGQACGLPVYRVDLAAAVSEYIGETEKNLNHVFESAAREGAILFFDEADALFGKRTQSRSANDRSADQQTAYLLQRIENYPGVVILAANLRSQVDDAFARRFQAVIHFRAPASSRARRVSRSRPTKSRPRPSRGRSMSR